MTQYSKPLKLRLIKCLNRKLFGPVLLPMGLPF
jgi:hypothetical protein